MYCGKNAQFLAAFALLRKAIISFVMSVHLSVCPFFALTEQMFIKLDI